MQSSPRILLICDLIMADLEDLMSALVDLYTVDNTRIGAHFASISHSRCMCVAVVGGRSAGWDV